MVQDAALRVAPANAVPWADLVTVMGTRGPASRCFCQRYRLASREHFAGFPAEERADRLRMQADCDNPGSGTTSGLVGYAGHEPVGWCAVAPRPEHAGLVRHSRVVWDGRDEDRADTGVWAVTCVLVRAGHRRRGVGHALARAAVEHARAQGARAVEAYPITTTAVIAEELHVGTVAMFTAAGLREVARPTTRRVVVRLDL